MRIYIENLTFSTIIGILEFERTTPQDVSIDIVLEYSYQNRNYID
ncbi:MAG TPA: dihydroneopterin aldolase, partial [Campylobacterales bacterium]|nr:dihydroneopterin aldolase [Campylobacterales bacterium]